MATTYDATKDRFPGAAPTTFGNNCVVGTKSDTVDFTSYPKGIVLLTAGDLCVVPLKATDDAGGRITFTGLTAGYVPPFRIRRVHSTGTTATFATIED